MRIGRAKTCNASSNIFSCKESPSLGAVKIKDLSHEHSERWM